MNYISPQADLALLINDQESDALDDGFAYEHMGADIELDRGTMGWVTPTAFMIVAMKELLARLVKIYGWHGHWLLREIGQDNLRDPCFVEGLGLGMFCKLQDAAITALPFEDREDFR